METAAVVVLPSVEAAAPERLGMVLAEVAVVVSAWKADAAAPSHGPTPPWNSLLNSVENSSPVDPGSIRTAVATWMSFATVTAEEAVLSGMVRAAVAAVWIAGRVVLAEPDRDGIVLAAATTVMGFDRTEEADAVLTGIVRAAVAEVVRAFVVDAEAASLPGIAVASVVAA